jgi:MOSC domain-containing protein YiiM
VAYRPLHADPGYASEDSLWWATRLAREVRPGAFGENLTVEGIDVSGAVIGERWRVGTVELQVCQPRLPCFKLGLRFGDPAMLKQFAQANRPGAYLRILVEGELGAGDAVEILDRPQHGVTIAQVARAIMLDESELAAAAAAPELPASLSRWMLERAA